MTVKCRYFVDERPKTQNAFSRFLVLNSELILLTVFSVLIIGGLYYRFLMYVAFGFIFVYLCFLSPEKSIEVLFFIISFESVFKFSRNSTSLFTFLQVVPILKILIRKENIQLSKYCLGSLIALLVYSVLFLYSGLLPLARMVLGLTLMTVILQGDVINRISSKRIVMFYSAGIIVSSVLAITNMDAVKPYVSDVIVRLSDGSALTRFSGLYMNANWYSTEVSLALSANAVLYQNKENSLIELLLIGGILLVFGIMSQSKTFVISFAVIIILLFSYKVIINPRTLIALAVIGIIAVLLWNQLGDVQSKFFSRFFELKEDDVTLSEITTGRSDIWNYYIDYIIMNPRILLLGAGIETQLGVAPHNAFIEMVFCMGIFGCILYFNTLVSIKQKTGMCCHFVVYLATLVLRMSTANVAFYNNVYYYYLLLFILMDSKTYKNRKSIIEDNTNVSRL